MRIIILITLSFAIASVFAAPNVYGFKDIRLGTNLSIIKKNEKFSCQVLNKPIADTYCYLALDLDATIANVPIETLMVLYYDKKLYKIVILFNSDRFSQVTSALINKYGSGKAREEIVRNGLGVEFNNTIITWKGKGSKLEMIKFSGNITKSTVTFTLNGYKKVYKERLAVSSQNNSEDL